jgi:hypothetical protein
MSVVKQHTMPRRQAKILGKAPPRLDDVLHMHGLEKVV